MNNNFSVVYSPEAKYDLKEIYKYPIVDWEPWKSMNMHKVPVDNYLVFYTVDNSNLKVTIIPIVYSGRDIASMAIEEN